MPDHDSLITEIYSKISNLINDPTVKITPDTPLIGDRSLLDSMRLVELCLSLEDKASEMGFEFDWTSDVAMSRSRSMFRTAGDLATEFISQWESKK